MADLFIEPLAGTIEGDANVSFGASDLDIAPNLDRIETRVSVLLRSDNVPLEPEYRIVIVHMDGQPVAELVNAVPRPVHWAVANKSHFTFTIPITDPQVYLCQPLEQEVQVYRGNRLLLWGVMLRPTDDGQNLVVQCQDLSYYFTRRLIGQVPKYNLIGNEARPARNKEWEVTSLPRSNPRVPPAKSYSPKITYNEHKSLALSSSVGRVEVTLDNDDIYNGSDLTASGKAQIDTIVADTFGRNPVISVSVHDDNSLSRKASKALAQARCDAIADYILDQKNGATVKATNDAYRNRLEPNSTAAGRNANRRTVFVYRDDDGTKGAKQVARHRFTVRNPGQDKKKREITLSAYVYVRDAANFAASFAGVELVRSDPRKNHKDPKWRKEGYKKPMQVSTVPLGKGTPLKTWVRCEVMVTLPNNGKKSIIESRLYVPNGNVYYSEVWLTANDSLWYKNEEQADIIRDLVDHAQDELMGKSDLNIKTNISDTGIPRTRDFQWSDRIYVYDALQEFQTLADGVEWDIVCTPTDRWFTTYFPRKGRDSTVVLANDSNLSGYTIDVDGTQISTTVIIGADGEGSSREERTVQDDTIMAGLVLEKAYLSTPNSPGSSWRKQAERGLARYRRPIIIPKVTIRPDLTDEFLQTVSVGDRLMTLIKDEWIDTAQKYRVTEMMLDPHTDSLTLTLFPEDLKILRLLAYNTTGWKYLSQDQKPIVGANGKRPVESNPEYAAPAFDDSGWSTGTAGIGWVKEPTGVVQQAVRHEPTTTVPLEHEVWMRRTVKCTGDMVVSARVADWGFVYVNGNLLTGDYLTGFNNNTFGYPHLYVPREWLNPSGVQTIAVHAQYDPDRYNSDRLDSLYADVRVRGTYDERMIL